MKILANDDGTYTLYASEKEVIATRIMAEHYLEHCVNLDPDNHRAHVELKTLCAGIKEATIKIMQ